ncbi:putative ATP-grasp-modified RiPP [Streptomyces sp. NPDC050617]|uniref:putative ATP-grasp-modified RiPP n=1 Tax=Streptomyces sp. NPDC050617 TaxID=3154628 RepID=UPI003441CD4F
MTPTTTDKISHRTPVPRPTRSEDAEGRAGGELPFGARAPLPAYVVKIDPSEFAYDPQRQVNVMADGRLWADTPMAASSTATNNDTSPGNPPDEDSDPYAFPGDEGL